VAKPQIAARCHASSEKFKKNDEDAFFLIFTKLAPKLLFITTNEQR
jgi:hypothetical protein